MLALRVERAADRLHFGGRIDEGHPEAALQVGRVVPAAASQLQNRRKRIDARALENAPVEVRFLRVVLRGGQERPPARQRPVHEWTFHRHGGKRRGIAAG